MRIIIGLLVLTGVLLPYNQAVAQSKILLVGTANNGLHSLEFDNGSREFGDSKVVANIDNPSFIAKSKSEKYLYIVDRGSNGKGGISSYEWNKQTQKLKLINRLSSEGDVPAYVSLNKANTQLALANFSTGNVVVYDIDNRTKALKSSPQVFQLSGSGPHPTRQTGPHAHWVQWSPDGRYLYVVDLGSDRIVGFSVNQAGRLSGEFTAFTSKPGAGPRHMAFHPKNDSVYIINELDNTVVHAVVMANGKFRQEQSLSLLPNGVNGANQAAHISIGRNGKTLYTSQRGHNSIAVFNIANNGALSLQQHAESGGNWPRHFRVVKEYDAMFVANQRADNVVLLDTENNGRLKSTGTSASLTAPTFILSLSVD